MRRQVDNLKRRISNMVTGRLSIPTVTLLIGCYSIPAAAQQAGRRSALEVEVERRGPIHEGFAQPVAIGATDGLLVFKRPPPLLKEYPPVLRPAAWQAMWLPGYWGWDNRKKDFVWVTGAWRVPPPGMRWVPGYWSARDDQFVWTPGFWYAAERPEVVYEPSPPQRESHQPDPPNPSADEFSVPGYWVMTSGGYVWRRGHVSPFHEGWVWMPTRRIATPAGSVLLRGYWDYPLTQRGVLFAPVSVVNGREASPAFTPQSVVNIGRLSGWLFTWTAYGHYCFGDYFGEARRERAIEPWFRAENDPVFAYERWRRAAAQPNWPGALAEQFARRTKQLERAADRRAAPSRELVIPFSDWSKAPGAPLPLMMGSYADRLSAAHSSEAIAQLARARASFETAAAESPEKAATFALPAAAPPTAVVRDAPRVGTTGEFIPGTVGREVPGFGRRTLPGMVGRIMPGVDTTAPGVVAPGVLPGADTRLPPGAELPKPQTPRKPR